MVTPAVPFAWSQPPAAPDPCAESNDVFVAADHVSLVCEDAHRRCSGTTAFVVRNCTEETVDVAELRLTSHDSTKIFEPATAVLEPGEAWTWEDTFTRDGTVSVQATLRHDRQSSQTAPFELRVMNPARDAAMAACRACSGDWSRHGRLAIEGCNCGTADAGLWCTDGKDCEGSCLFDHFDVVRPARSDCRRHGSCHVEPAMGIAIGTCSSHVMVFGCHARLRDGAANGGLTRLPARVPRVCVD